MIYGDARVSTGSQSEAAQVAALKSRDLAERVHLAREMISARDSSARAPLHELHEKLIQPRIGHHHVLAEYRVDLVVTDQFPGPQPGTVDHHRRVLEHLVERVNLPDLDLPALVCAHRTSGAAVTTSGSAGAQQRPRIPRIGIIDNEPDWDAFRQELHDLNYTEGHTVEFEYRRADGMPERLAAAARELAQLPVDVVFDLDTEIVMRIDSAGAASALCQTAQDARINFLVGFDLFAGVREKVRAT